MTSVGVPVPFRITEFEPGRYWRWRVAGLPATGHRVETLDAQRCEVTFDVPAFAAPYARVCRHALESIAELAERDARHE